MKRCKACGQPIQPAGPALDWGTLSLVDAHGSRRPMAARVFDFLWVLVMYRGQHLTKTQILSRMYGELGEWPEDHILRVYACEARKVLSGTGWQVATIRAVGYALVKEEL